MENSKEKQIEEMAKDFCAVGIPCEECHLYKNRCHAKKYATRAYNAGYRKASEVAREISEELIRYLRLNEDIAIKCKAENGEQNREYFKGKLAAYLQIRGFIDVELKKKYTQEK